MNEKVCRLCLQTISNNNCQTVEESLLKSFKLNINVSKENVMCIECASCLQVFSNFTSGCFYTGDGLEDGFKLDPEAIKTSNSKSLMETKIKCSFCKKTYGRQVLISLMESKENMFLVTMLKQYILDMIKNTEELLTCETCHEALQDGLNVILKCLEVEEKISKYIELKGTDDKGQIELKSVRKFMFKPVMKLEIESFGVNELEGSCEQVHGEYTTMAETEMKYEKEINNTELIIKTEDYDIKSEQNDCDITDIKSEQIDCDGLQEPSTENRNPNDLLPISVITSETRKPKGHTKQLLTLKKVFHCEICSYEAKQKRHLKQHLLTHKAHSEIKTFKCELCSHKTKYKSALKLHLLTHKIPSEIKMFKCEMCLYEATRKVNLKRHLLTHKCPSEVKTFKCEFCSHVTKYKFALKLHLLTHKTPSETKTFKCELCSHETKYKSALKLHLLTHKNPSEIKMFKCESCSYEAKQKAHLKGHLLTHRSPCEIKMFKCELCSYETKHRVHLRRHSLTHKTPFEIGV